MQSLLIAHSHTRWLVLVMGAVALGLAVRSLSRTPDVFTRRAWLAWVVVVTLEVMMGLVLLAVSPTVQTALSDMKAAMKTSSLRFWIAEHPTLMIVALGVCHAGFAKVRRAAPPEQGKKALIFFGITLLLILAAIPWPFLSYGRQLIRLP